MRTHSNLANHSELEKKTLLLANVKKKSNYTQHTTVWSKYGLWTLILKCKIPDKHFFFIIQLFSFDNFMTKQISEDSVGVQGVRG